MVLDNMLFKESCKRHDFSLNFSPDNTCCECTVQKEDGMTCLLEWGPCKFPLRIKILRKLRCVGTLFPADEVRSEIRVPDDGEN